ncbi:GNAT family N-acetyltransferase [Streptomyces lincolnensis]|uniref:GNAT family N-acetyltransferase n=1 Tax=Streptomyces lincolnensis TaxID=1915 RepID=UPI001E2F0346|nr:GNAT family N-acetyltransferase [Streptomyces lincolnensis]MCD7442054.1 GNAT family N-acetyltransferase [Streptomyces lincolnensis]
MTTTLRPIEPLQRAADGTCSRRFQVCVNSRPVGVIHLGTSPTFGAEVALITDLRIEEPDRRRGRATVAVLAAEEVARGWGCRRIEAAVPAEAGTALGLATALGYVVRNRLMGKTVGATAPVLPAGSRSRPMTQAEFAVWTVHAKEEYAQSWISRGVPESEARVKADKDHDKMLPDGPDTEGVLLSVLEHEGTPVGTLWLAARNGFGFVYDVETAEAHRGRGHGRSLMLVAEAQTAEAGWPGVRLNVFAGNTPAERLYASLGYETITHHVFKELL